MPNAAEMGPQRVQLSHRQILIIYSGLMLGMLLSALDQTIVSTALPRIAGDFQALSQQTWVVTSYLLTSTITILLWGKLSDILGRKAMFQAAIGIFLAASALAGLAPSMLFLVVARGLQGIGAGGIMTLAMAIIGDILSPRERGKYQGLIGAVFAFATVVGPFVGGGIVDYLHVGSIASWRWIFYINLPIGIPAIFITGIVLKLPFHRQKTRIDWTGAALVAAGTGAILLGLVWGGTGAPWDTSCSIQVNSASPVYDFAAYNLRWFPGQGTGAVPACTVGPGGPVAAQLTATQQFLSDWLVTLLVGTGVALLALFLWVETRVASPILPLRLFRDGVFRVANTVSFVIGAAMFGGIIFLPSYLQISTGASATLSGLLLLPMMGGIILCSMASGIVISRSGRYKWWPVVGLPLAIAGTWMLATLTPDTDRWFMWGGMFLLGAGIGMTMQVMLLAVQNALQMRDMGVGTAANNFLRSMGSVFGVGIFGAVFANRLAGPIAQAIAVASRTNVPFNPADLQGAPEVIHALPPAIRDPITAGVADGVAHVFLYALPLLVLAFLVVLLLKEVPLRASRHIGGEGKAPEIVAVTAGEGAAPAPPTPPVLPGATPANRPLSLAPANGASRRAPGPYSLAEIQRAVDAMAVRPRQPTPPANRRR